MEWVYFKQEQVRSLVGRSYPHPRSKLAVWDVESWGSALLPEVYPKPSRGIPFLPGGYLSRHRSVPDLEAEGLVGRRNSNKIKAWQGSDTSRPGWLLVTVIAEPHPTEPRGAC